MLEAPLRPPVNATLSTTGRTLSPLSIYQRSESSKVKKIVSKLELFIENPGHGGDEAAAGCLLLGEYAQDDYYRVIIVSAGAIRVLARILRVFQDNSLVQTAAFFAAVNLCFESTRNQVALEKEGIFDLVVAALKNHKSCRDVQTNALIVAYLMSKEQPDLLDGFVGEAPSLLQRALDISKHDFEEDEVQDIRLWLS